MANLTLAPQGQGSLVWAQALRIRTYQSRCYLVSCGLAERPESHFDSYRRCGCRHDTPMITCGSQIGDSGCFCTKVFLSLSLSLSLSLFFFFFFFFFSLLLFLSSSFSLFWPGVGLAFLMNEMAPAKIIATDSHWPRECLKWHPNDFLISLQSLSRDVFCERTALTLINALVWFACRWDSDVHLPYFQYNRLVNSTHIASLNPQGTVYTRPAGKKP